MKQQASSRSIGTRHIGHVLGGFLFLALSAPMQAQMGIEDVVRQALEHSPEVQERWHDFQSSGHARVAARGGYKPTVSVNAAYGRQRENFITGNPMNTGFAEIALTQLLWDGGRTRANVAEFSKIELVRYFELLDRAEETALEAMRAYLDVVRQRELVRLAEENLATHQEVYDQVAESARAGVARTADLEQINGRLALAEANLLNEQSNLHDVSARYLRIVGDLPPHQLRAVNLDVQLPATVQDALMESYRHNPMFHATLRNITAAESATDAQRSERMPRLNLAARYGVQTRDDFGTRQNHTDGRIGLELTWDLYTGGRNSANIRRTTALEGSAMSLRDRACVDIRQETQIAFHDRLNLTRQLPILNQHRISSDRVRTAYRQQFEIGQRTLLDVLDSENEFFEASRAWTNASYNETLALARTLRAMGLLLETLSVGRNDIPSLADLGAQPMDIDPATACPLGNGRLAPAHAPALPERPTPERVVATEVTLSSQATFNLDSAELRPAAQERLSELVASIREGRLVSRIQVVGHTCDLGPEAHNQDLSERRARAVVAYLRSAGIGEDEITWEGRGESEPRYPNDSEQNRSRNRRVEITYMTEQTSTSRVPVSPDGPITELRQTRVPADSLSIDKALSKPYSSNRNHDASPPRPATPTAAGGELAPDLSLPDNSPARNRAIQVGSFSIEANASRLVEQLQALGHEVYVVKSTAESQAVWLVRVSAPGDQQAALALLRELHLQTGLDGQIVS